MASIGPGGIEILEPDDGAHRQGQASIGPGGIEMVLQGNNEPYASQLQSDQEELKCQEGRARAGKHPGFNRTRRN